MDAKDKFQIIFWLVGIVFWLVSMWSIRLGFRQYRTGLRQRTAQGLIDLEERFEAHREIARKIDPESRRFETELLPAVETSLAGVPHFRRKPEEREAIHALDEFLRFLLLVSGLERYQILDRDATNYMYWYWFSAVKENRDLMKYVGRYFPTLNGYLNSRTFGPPPHERTRA